MEPTTELLDDILKKLLAANVEVGAVAIVSTEGLPIASALPSGADETRLAAMTSALFRLSEQSIIELRKGNFDQIHIKGSDGYIVVVRIGPYAILLLSTTDKNTKIDLNMFRRLSPLNPPGSSGATATVEKGL